MTNLCFYFNTKENFHFRIGLECRKTDFHLICHTFGTTIRQAMKFSIWCALSCNYLKNLFKYLYPIFLYLLLLIYLRLDTMTANSELSSFILSVVKCYWQTLRVGRKCRACISNRTKVTHTHSFHL